MLTEIAQRYLNHGWNVVPLKPKSKEPLIKWTDLQTRRVTSLDLSGLFKDPMSNIGIITGSISQLVVVDADGKEGLDSLRALSLSSPVIAITGKGRHLYFSHTGPAIRNSVRKIAPGIDIRAEGGYVLASPSIHPETGKRYRWLTDFRLPLPQLPVAFLSGLVRNGDTKVSGVEAKPSGWLEEAFSKMQHGNMDETFTRVCGKLRYSGFSESDAFTILTPWIEKAEVIWPPANQEFLRKKITHIWRSYEAKASVVVDNEEAESVNKFLESNEQVTWIVPGMIAKNSIGFCVGLPEAQKTWLMMDLAVQAATGGKWCGLFPVARTKTLFIEQERFKGETQRRFRALLNGVDCGDDLHIKCGSSIKIDLEHSYNAFVRLLDKLRPELVIIDSLVTIHTKEENNRTEIQSVMEKFKTLRQQFNCAFFFISHSNKFAFQAAKEGNEPDVSLMAGSIALPAAAETVFMVQKATGGGSTVHHVKSTLSEKIKPFGILVEDIIPNGIIVRGIK